MPHFQPIVSVETQAVAAYEALARLEVPSGTQGLSDLMQVSPLDPEAWALRREVDRTVRHQALDRFAREGAPDQSLFLNIDPRLMVEHLSHGGSEPPFTLRAIEEASLDPRRVVIELTEEAVGSRTPDLRRLIGEYRARGCRIAVDDVGAEASNLDRIGYFSPDVIKVDANLLRRAQAERPFVQVLQGLQVLADGIGASLLFEGVETRQDLDLALTHGARYLQGWYFARAAADLAAPQQFADRLRSELQDFGRRRVAEIRSRDHGLGVSAAWLSAYPPVIQPVPGGWVLDEATLERWGGPVCRVYLCDEEGFQVSPDYVFRAGAWRAEPGARGRFRGARPYFSPRGSPALGGNRIWSATEPYFDPEDGRLMRTFGRTMAPGVVLFADLPEIENPPRNG